MESKKTTELGFTLIEVMVAIAVISVVMGAAYSVFDSQRKLSVSQSEGVDMQQSIRAAMYYMEREIRIAGYPGHSTLSPTSGKVPGTGILLAGRGRIRVASDIFDRLDNDGDGEIDEWDEDDTASPGISFRDGLVTALNEDITYGIAPAYDDNGDGLVDAGKSPPGTDPGAAPIGRDDINDAGGYMDLAESIQAVGFAYAFDNDGNDVLDFRDTNPNGIQDPGEPTIWAHDSDGDGMLDTIADDSGPAGIPDGVIDTFDTPGGVPMGFLVYIEKIKAVKVWLLARTKHPIARHKENRTYVVGDKHIVCNDAYQRRLLTTTIKCRNM